MNEDELTIVERVDLQLNQIAQLISMVEVLSSAILDLQERVKELEARQL